MHHSADQLRVESHSEQHHDRGSKHAPFGQGKVRHPRPTLAQRTGEYALHNREQKDSSHQQAKQGERGRPPVQRKNSSKDQKFSREAYQSG